MSPGSRIRRWTVCGCGGHTLEVMHGWGASGSEMMIQVNQDTGALHGAADPRRDGYAIGW